MTNNSRILDVSLYDNTANMRLQRVAFTVYAAYALGFSHVVYTTHSVNYKAKVSLISVELVSETTTVSISAYVGMFSKAITEYSYKVHTPKTRFYSGWIAPGTYSARSVDIVESVLNTIDMMHRD